MNDHSTRHRGVLAILDRATLGLPLLRYGLLSGLSFCLNLGISFAAHEWLAAPEEIAFLLAVVVVFFVNFFGMKYFVYLDPSPGMLRQMMMFALSTMGFRVVEYLAFLGLHTGLEIHYLVAIASVIIVSFFLKFVFYRTWVFGRRGAS